MRSVVAACALAVCGVATSASSAAVSVRFDHATGAWVGLIAGAHNLIARTEQDVDVAWDGGRLPPLDGWRLISIRRRGASVVVTRRAGGWQIRTTTRVSGWNVLRDAAFRWLGPQPVTVRGAALMVPGLRLSSSPDDRYLIPGNFPVTRRLYRDLRPGAETSEVGWTRGEYGVAIVASAEARLTLIAGGIFRMDDARVSVREARGAVTIVHRYATAVALRPGQEITCGTQVVRIVSGGGEATAAGALARFADRLGNGPPADRPASLDKCVIYEAHPWGRLETWRLGDNGNRLSRLIALMPYYRSLGVTTLWLMPVSWPPPWVYELPELNRIAPEVGDAAQLRQLVRTGHANGIRTLLDLVVYGIKPDSPEVARLPADVWCCDPAGKRRIVWGGAVLAADCSNAAWQRRIARSVRQWARDFGVDGARLDCAGWGQAENWRSPLRADASTVYGGLQLNKVVRDAFREHNRDAFILPEAGRPLAFRHADLAFDYPLYLAMRDMTVRPDLARWVADLREWLDWERQAYPRRALPGLVRFLELHDTVDAAQYFGVGPSQALMAICCLIQGTPLIYQEQETGFSRDLAAWLQLRNSDPCFYHGAADYRAIRCSDPRVFCFLRTCAAGADVVAVNLTGEPIRCRLSWPAAVSARFPHAREAFSGAMVPANGARAGVAIPAYRPVVLQLRARPMNGPRPPRAAAGPQWRVETGEGVLQDGFRDWHVTTKAGHASLDLLPVLQRAWNPLESGLLDHATSATLSVTRTDGRTERVAFDPRRATVARIEDPTTRPDDARVVVETSPSGRPCAPEDAGVQVFGCSGIQARSAAFSRDAPRAACRCALSGRGGGAGRVDVTAQFVTVHANRFTLVLARRHGGVPVALTPAGSGASVVAPGGDLYTDWGIYDRGHYASCDGDTNPRLHVEEERGAATVTFTGTLRDRSWNGVQFCGTPSPPTRYRLAYRAGADGRLTITLAITPPRNDPHASAFVALRLPLAGCTGWRCGDAASLTGTAPEQRVFQTKAAPGAEAALRFAGSEIRLDAQSGLGNCFLVDSTGAPALFLALMDGEARDLHAGQEVAGSVMLDFGTR